MDYIINPWLIYWMEVAQSVVVANTIVFIISLISIILVCIKFALDEIDLGRTEAKQIRQGSLKILYPICFISLILGIFLPDKTTIIQMFVAKNLTYTNANKLVDRGKILKDELKKDVIDIILAVKEKK